MLTSDQNISDLDYTVLYRVKDAGQFLFNLRDPEETVKVISESAIREVVGMTRLEDLLTISRQSVERDSRSLLQELLDDYEVGILIQSIQLQDVNPPKEVIDAFKSKVKDSKIDRFAICANMQYLPDIATPKDDAFEKSVNTLINEVERCAQLGIPYLVTHLGSHLGTGEEAGIKKLVEALTKAGQTKNDVMILLENTAGQKNSVGSDFKQLGEIFKQLKVKIKAQLFQLS